MISQCFVRIQAGTQKVLFPESIQLRDGEKHKGISMFLSADSETDRVPFSRMPFTCT